MNKNRIDSFANMSFMKLIEYIDRLENIEYKVKIYNGTVYAIDNYGWLYSAKSGGTLDCIGGVDVDSAISVPEHINDWMYNRYNNE